jgi:hypothetical protein
VQRHLDWASRPGLGLRLPACGDSRCERLGLRVAPLDSDHELAVDAFQLQRIGAPIGVQREVRREAGSHQLDEDVPLQNSDDRRRIDVPTPSRQRRVSSSAGSPMSSSPGSRTRSARCLAP